MKQRTPLVSVLMTAYNAERYVGQAIKSIIKQTYDTWELVIVDDGSTDKTLDVVKKYAKADKRIRVFQSEKNSGPSHASNLGLSKVKGNLVARMDADDISHPLRLEKQVAYFERYPETVVLGGTCTLIDGNGNYLGMKTFPIGHVPIYQALYRMNPIQHPACMINLSLLPNNKLVYHNGSMLAHDLEMLFEVAQYGQLANMEDVLLYYRQHSASLSLKNPKETFAATLEVRKKAIKRYGYKPNLKSQIIHLMQKLLVFCLPTSMIYPLFTLLRTGKRMILHGMGEQKLVGIAEKHVVLSELSIFVPAYNEEKNIAAQIEHIIGAASTLAKKYEVIIVDDGSTDKTGKISDSLAGRYPQVQVIHQENRGYGGALKTGFKEARFKWVFFTDSDLQFDMSELRYLIEQVNNADMVLGYRSNRVEGFRRSMLAKLLHIWAWFWLGFPLDIEDIDCAFKLMKADVIRSILPLLSDGAMISTEMLLKAKRAGFLYEQVAVSHLPRLAGKPTGNSMKVIFRAVKETFLIRKQIREQKLRIKPILATINN
jgi:glycosyltransferase involved in cell wall biosynthesis